MAVKKFKNSTATMDDRIAALISLTHMFQPVLDYVRKSAVTIEQWKTMFPSNFSQDALKKEIKGVQSFITGGLRQLLTCYHSHCQEDAHLFAMTHPEPKLAKFKCSCDP